MLQAKQIVICIILQHPRTIDIVEGITYTKVRFQETNEINLTYTGYTVVISNLDRSTCRVEQFLASLGILNAGPCSIAILVNNLYLSLVFVVGRGITKDKGSTVEHLNTIAYGSICFYYKCDASLLAIVSVYHILWVIGHLTTIDVLKFLLGRVYCNNKGRTYTNVLLETLTFC